MKIHEYQGKELLKKFGVAVPDGIPVVTPDRVQALDQAVAAAQQLGGEVWVVKAQIHAGGRGKGGGVKVARSVQEVRQFASDMLGMQLVTHQTGPQGQTVKRLLIEKGADIRCEYYVGIVTDRATQQVCVMASSEGGMDVEEVAKQDANKILKVFVDPAQGLLLSAAKKLATDIGVPPAVVDKAAREFQNLYRAYWETDATLAEINPLVLTGSGDIVALDAKFNFDPNALSRHPDILAYRDLDEENPAEREAHEFDLAYIQLEGNIGCLVNGAGLAMATMDTIKLFGGEPANFLDVGGGANTEKVKKAFSLMLKNQGVRAILVNIFGGIMRCDVIAEGIITACKELGDLHMPLIVRMHGTNEELGKKKLEQSGLSIMMADTMAQAATQVVAATTKAGVATRAAAKATVVSAALAGRG